MDKDGDGFISYSDLQAHMIRLKIFHSENEFLSLMHTVIDPERKGYVDFPTF
jgi:Ca2+-binding EF-hand superfamily protein